VSARFEELDWCATEMGELSLRRRWDPVVRRDVYEVKLDDEYLMSSLFTVAEEELARLGLAALDVGVGVGPDDKAGAAVDVLVGGLGLGYTARAVLEDDRVRSLHVVEAADAVISWHERGLLPLAGELTSDPRTHLVLGDFFALMAGGDGTPPELPALLSAILLDIDHTPDHLLHPAHGTFYTPDGLARLATRLHPGGVFALWSDAAPDPAFLQVLGEVFAEPFAHVVEFPNPLTGGASANTVYTATRPRRP
jgi:spermidine synthase